MAHKAQESAWALFGLAGSCAPFFLAAPVLDRNGKRNNVAVARRRTTSITVPLATVMRHLHNQTHARAASAAQTPRLQLSPTRRRRR